MDINEPMINEEIRDREVRVISADGTQLGVMATRAAIELAEKEGLEKERATMLEWLKRTASHNWVSDRPSPQSSLN